LCLGAKPYWAIRYNRVHSWLEEFYQGSNISDCRERATKSLFYQNIVENYMDNLFGILIDTEDEEQFESDINTLKDLITKGITIIENDYNTLNKIYRIEVTKALRGDFNEIGLSVFEKLAIVKICDEKALESYIKIYKNYLLQHFKANEPNAEIYYPYFNDIVDKLNRIKI